MDWIERRKEEETVDWLSSEEAGKEFRAEWLDNNLPSGWQYNDTSQEDLKAILKNRECTKRKKSLLKKQIKDLKIYLGKHLPWIKEEEILEKLPDGLMKDPTRHCKPGPGCEMLPKGWNYTPDKSLVNMGKGITNEKFFYSIQSKEIQIIIKPYKKSCKATIKIIK